MDSWLDFDSRPPLEPETYVSKFSFVHGTIGSSTNTNLYRAMSVCRLRARKIPSIALGPLQPRELRKFRYLSKHIKLIFTGLQSICFHLAVLLIVSHTEEELYRRVDTDSDERSTQVMTGCRVILIAASGFRPTDYRLNGYY